MSRAVSPQMAGHAPRFVLAGFPQPRDGYGYGTIKIGEALARAAGEAVEVVDLRKRTEFGVPVVAVCTPDWLTEIEAPTVISHTMFEATRLPAGWAEKLNAHADAVIVPCQWNAEVFAENGVLRPLSVVRWGIDPGDYFPLERDGERAPYTFLWSGTPDKRKGWDVTYRAFRMAFGDSQDVRLVLHFRELPKGLQGCNDGNVELIVGRFFRPRLRRMLQDADCFVFPSRGEGWGLPPREAAATGLPAIATHHGGLAEEIDHWALPLRTTGTSPADYGFWDEDIGEWAEPDVGACADLLRWCVERPVTARMAGDAAAYWLATYGTWDRTAAGILDVVKEVIRC